MYFENFSALLSMDGHGFYVWLAYGVSLLVLLGLVTVPVLQGRTMRRQFQARQSTTTTQPLVEGS